MSETEDKLARELNAILDVNVSEGIIPKDSWAPLARRLWRKCLELSEQLNANDLLSGRGREDESSDSERHGISNPDNAGSIPAVRSKLHHYREMAKTREHQSVGSAEELIAEDEALFEAFRPSRERANSSGELTEQRGQQPAKPIAQTCASCETSASGVCTRHNSVGSAYFSEAEQRGDETLEDCLALIVRDVAELPDRSSPEDWPEAMLVTDKELREIVRERIEAYASSRLAQQLEPWKPEDGDTKCQQCFAPNPLWFAPNEIWNQVIGKSGVLCPNCFLARAKIDGAWKLVPEDAEDLAQAQEVSRVRAENATLRVELERLKERLDPDNEHSDIAREQGRWQVAIYDFLCRESEYPEGIDGGGCDSGDPLDFTLAEINQLIVQLKNERNDADAKLARLTGERDTLRLDHKCQVEALSDSLVEAMKLNQDQLKAHSDESCGKPAGSLHPRLGLSYACVLSKDHDGECQPGGNCFAHGKYIGLQCPEWPKCAESIPVAGRTKNRAYWQKRAETAEASIIQAQQALREIIPVLKESQNICEFPNPTWNDIQRLRALGKKIFPFGIDKWAEERKIG